MKNVFTAAIAVALAFASCVKTQGIDGPTPPPVLNGNVAAKFTADIAALSTRVSNNQFDMYDAVGIYMKQAGEPLSASIYSNIELTAMSSSSLVVAAGEDPMYYPETGNVDFVAYYPYREEFATANLLDIDLAAYNPGAQFVMSEPLYSNSSVGISKTADPIPLQFKYVLPKIVVTVTATPESGLDESDFADMTAKIDGLPGTGWMSLADGTFSNPGVAATIAMVKTASDATRAVFETFVLPTVWANEPVTFSFTIDDKTFSNTVTEKFESGNQYNMPFRISTALPPELVAVYLGATISDRTQVNRPEIVVTPQTSR